MSHIGSLCLALVVAAVLAAAGDAPAEETRLTVVRPGHPRLLITQEDLPRLHRQPVAYPKEWARVRDVGLWPPRRPGYEDARTLRNAALAYVITGEEPYFRNALALAQNIARNHQPDTYASPEALFSLALAYDWLYHGLTETQRAELTQGLLRICDYLASDRIWRHSDFNNHFVLEKVWPLVYTSLALYGDVQDPRLEQCLRTAEEYVKDHLLPAANFMAGHSGGQHEGYSYDAWGYMRPMAFVFEAWRTATGEDLFQSCTATRYHALWSIYGRRPFDHRMEHFDDAGLDQAWSDANEGDYIYLLAARHRDGRAQWLGDQLPRRYDSFLWPLILWRDPDLPPQPPDDLPTARLFDGLGWLLMRSSWEDDATFASFQCGPFLTGHQHLDNNAFTIHKGSLLALDSGVNAYGEGVKTDYRANYYSRTIAHNSLLVFDPKEVFRGGAWAGEASGGANDGGQLRLGGLERVADVRETDRWDVGRIVAYRHHTLFTYAVGDASKSYRPAKLRLFLRHFLFLPPNLFIVFDQVASTDPSFQKTWLLHSVDEPRISGPVTTITNGPGRLVCRTLLPEEAAIAAIGGQGKECWVDGRNWPAVEREWTPDAGAWRLEVSPSHPAEQDFFLHVLQVDGDQIASPETVSLVRETGRLGVRVLAQGCQYLALFSSQAEPRGHLTITREGVLLLDTSLP